MASMLYSTKQHLPPQMKIEIDSSKTIESVQRLFNETYPYLKIEFFTQPHEKGKPTAARYMVSPKRLLSETTPMKVNSTLQIEADMPVYELEKMFEENFGLHVQVFRKSGRIWLETTATDDWTLESQNEQGRELSENHPEKGELPDYHEQE